MPIPKHVYNRGRKHRLLLPEQTLWKTLSLLKVHSFLTSSNKNVHAIKQVKFNKIL